MKKIYVFLCTLVMVFGLALPAGAWIMVPSYGDTDWQSYTYTAGPYGFEGTAGFVVSNQGDTELASSLLLDNLIVASNGGFETGDYTGFTLVGTSYGTVITGPVTALSGNVYLPTQDSYMSQQMSFDADTSGFLNSVGNPGTNGSILEGAISLGPAGSFTFDWAFLTTDYMPYQDFSLFYLNDATGAIVFTDGLGQINPVPLPGALLLFGTGLVGLATIRKRFKKD